MISSIEYVERTAVGRNIKNREENLGYAVGAGIPQSCDCEA